MYRERFDKEVYVTRYARERLVQRSISEAVLMDLLETGDARFKDDTRLWGAAAVAGRDDHLLCVAAAFEETVVVKTVMHHFAWES